MTDTQESSQDGYESLNGIQYVDFLNLVPIFDLRAELERLDEPCSGGTCQPFGLPQSYRSDVSFRCLLRRQVEAPINSTPEDNEIRSALLHKVSKLRHIAKTLDVQEMEYVLRKTVAEIEGTDDPDTSFLQNLISVILSKAATSPTGSSHYE